MGSPSSPGEEPLRGVEVIDLAGPAAVFATRILADLGAHVLRLEPPGGDAVRHRAPFLDGDAPLIERGLYHLQPNAKKGSMVVRGAPAGGRRALAHFLHQAEVVVET